MPRPLTPSIDYIRKLYAPQDALLENIAQTLTTMGTAIQIGPEEGKLLQMFMILHNVRNIVEIGTLAGYSALWMARALPPEAGHLYTINKDPDHIAMAKHFFDQSEVVNRITMLEGDAHEQLPSLNEKGPFDMVFIDADKISYNDYLDWAEQNVRKYGLIIADNTLLFGSMGLSEPPDDVSLQSWYAMRRFNERLADDKRYFANIIPTQEGMTVAIKLF